MSATDKPKHKIQEELARLRSLVAKLERAEDEHQETEEALRQSEERFRQLASSIHEVFWLVSLDKSRVFYISPAYERVWGRSCESLYGDPRSWVDAIHPDDRASVIEALPSERPSGKPIRYRIIKPGGEIRWIESLAYPVTNEAGEVYRIAGISEDITERRRAEEQAARFSRVLENSLNEIYIFDAETLQLVEVNRGARENLGYSLEELRSLTPVDLKPEFTPETFAQLLEPLRAGVEKKIQFTTVHRRKNGTQYPIDVHLQLVDDGAPVFVGIILDITERKRVEEALRRSEERLDLAVRGTSDGLWDADLETGKEYWSPRYKELLGYAEDEIEATFNQFLAFLHPEDKADVLEAVRLHLEENQPYDCEFRMQTKCGEYRWFQSRGEALRDKSGKPYRVVGSIRDITERKRVEEELRLKQFAIDHSSDSIYWVGADGRIAYVNHAACRSLGYSRDELLLMSVPDFDPNFPRETWSAQWEGLREACPTTFESCLRTKQGRVFPVEISTNFLVYEGQEYLWAYVRDLTERKRTEEELWLKQFAIDHSSDSIYWVRADGQIAYVNHAACRSLGYSRDELLLMSVPDFDPDFPRETWPAQWERLRQICPTTFESRHRTKQGRVFPVEISTNFLAHEGQEYLWAYVRDLTERKRAEKDLRVSEQRFRAMFEQAGVGVAQIETATGRFMRINKKYSDIMGLTPEEMTATTFMEISHPDDLKADLDNMERLKQCEIREFTMEKRLFRRDGSVVWVNLTVSPMWAPGEKPNWHIAVVEDISERKQVEEALRKAQEELEERVEQRTAELEAANARLRGEIAERREAEQELRASERRYRAVVEDQTELICRWKPDGGLLFVNDAYCRYFDRSREELLGNTFMPRIPQEDQASVQEHFASFSPAKPVDTHEHRVFAPNGQVRWQQWTNRAIFDGQGRVSEYQSVGRDITQRKRTEEALIRARDELEKRVTERTAELVEAGRRLEQEVEERRQAERAIQDQQRQLDSLLSNVDAIILEGDPYDIYYVGGQVERILGYPKAAWFADPEGAFGFWAKHLHPEDTGTIETCKEAIARGVDHSFEYRMLAKNGDTIWFYDRVTVETENGKPVKARSVMIDISERKQAERTRDELGTQLRHAQRMEAVGQLAGGVAHDFNNLLTVILGNVEMLLGGLRNGSGENKRLLEQVQLSAERGAELVEQLLAFGRRRPARSTVFDLKGLMERMEELMRPLLREDIHLRLHLPEEQALIKADPAQIEQVIMNLLLNARGALPSFGEISLSCEHVVIHRDVGLPRPVAPGSRFVVMTVSDTGTGMDADTLDRIFEPFFTTKAVGEGTGLGLATVYGIVADCDAQIAVESTLGQGSIFRIYFPAADHPARVE